MTDPIDLNHPDVVRLTEILQQLTAMFSAGGFQSEIRDPYTEYGSEIPGRDMSPLGLNTQLGEAAEWSKKLRAHPPTV
jgi:hypothetical protein